MKQTALLARAGSGGGEKHIKRGAKIELWASLRFFWVGLPSRLKHIFFFACQINLGSNTDPSVASNFAAVKQN